MNTPNLGLHVPTNGVSPGWGDDIDAAINAVDALAAGLQFDLAGVNQAVTPAQLNTFTKILFSHTSGDMPAWFDAANNQLKPNVPCQLFLHFFTALDDGGSGLMMRSGLPAIFKNGVAIAYGTEANMVSAAIRQGRGFANAIVTFNGTTDAVQGYLYTPAGAATILGDLLSTGLMITRLK